MKINHFTLSKKLFSIILLLFLSLLVMGQTEKPLSEFEKHKEKAADYADKQDWQNCITELETLLKIAGTKEEKIDANLWLAKYFVEQKGFLKAIYYYEEVLKLDENNLDAIEGLGAIYSSAPSMEAKTKKALPLLLKAEQLETYFDIACIYSIQNDTEHSIQYLDKAIYHGYENIEWIQKDSNLENIRKTEYYSRLINNWDKLKQGQDAIGEGLKANDAFNYDMALKSFLKAEDLYNAVVGNKSIIIAITSGWAGRVYYFKGEYDKAIEYYTKSLAIFKNVLGGEHPLVSSSYGGLGLVYNNKGEYDKAIEYYTKDLAISLKTLGDEHPNVATVYNNIGLVYDHKGEYDKAIEYYTKSLGMSIKTFGDETPEIAASYNNLGSAYKSKGEYDKAIEYFTKFLAIYMKNFGDEHPEVATSYNNLGVAHASKREYDKAIEYFTKSLAIYIKTFGSEHQDVATSYNNLGDTYSDTREYDEAIEYFKKSLAIKLKTFGREHPGVATSYNNLGKVYYSKGEYANAIEYLQKAIHIYEKSEERDNYIITYISLKEIYLEQNQTEMAIHALTQAMELVLKFRQKMGQDKTAFTQRHLSVFTELIQLYQETNQPEKAFEISEKMRGLSMMEDFQRHLALNRSGIPKDKSSNFLTMQKNLESLYSQKTAMLKSSKTPPLAIAKLKNTIQERERKLATIENEFDKKYPQYATMKKIKFSSIPELKTEVRERNATIIEYVLATNKDGKESLHAFVISPNGFKSVDLGKDLDITRRVNNLRLIISQYPTRRTFIALKREDGALVLADAAQCKGFQEGENCSKFVIDYESKLDESGNFKLKEVILGIQERKVEPEESAKLMQQYSKEIYDIVIKPVEKYTTEKIIICPDGALFTIPFAALITDNGEYLAEKYSISLIQSATAWMKLEKEKTWEYTYPLFAMGNSIYGSGHSDTKGISEQRGFSWFIQIIKDFIFGDIDRRFSFSWLFYELFGNVGQRGLSTENKREVKDLDNVNMKNLPGSLEELKFLSKTIYNSDSFNEHIISGIHANKDELYKRFGVNHKSDQYRIIHFSVHGLFFSDSPELNSLAFTSREKALEYKKEELKPYEEKNGKIKRDGFLKMGDVAELDLKTDLLVMSACETSLGTVKAGEGMVGLPQAFLMGGANNVLATLWSVDDTGTMLFFKEYYKNLLDKKLTSVDALKLTQKNLSKKGKDSQTAKVDYTDPFYWSPFVVYGK
jgi:tetratricopeptide (TPR) repeat protein